MTRLSVRARLWLALGFLVAATLTVGAVSWISLARGTERLDRLHAETLAGVDRALSLSRRAADLSTLAPYLLTLDSPFRIAEEGRQAIALVDGLAMDVTGNAPLRAELARTRDAITELVRQTSDRAALQDRILRINAALAHAERAFAARAATSGAGLAQRQEWLALQRQSAALLGAARASNLIGVGEFQREYVLLTQPDRPSMQPAALQAQQDLRGMAEGPGGLFELRRLELSHKINAESALVRIRQGAAAVTAHADFVTTTAQTGISAERARTTTAIALSRSAILFVGLVSVLVALVAALFVSSYVTSNLRAVSDAMMRLAAGDRQSRLQRGEGAGDEIGKLFHAFRTFRANALRLDRSHRQMTRRTALYESMMAGIRDGVAVLNDQGAVLTCNDQAAQVLRLDPAHLRHRPRLGDLVQRAGWTVAPAPGGHTALCSADGRHVEWREGPLPGGGSVVLVTDTTERRLMETRLNQIQRIEALGKVSGEVAHDFGNILSTISGSLHLMETTPPARQANLRRILGSAVDLGMSLTQRLLSFARRQQLDPETVELNSLVDGMADLIGFALRDDITLTIEPSATPLPVRVDPGQLESAVLNLCLNAAQAIEGPGQITISLRGSDGRALIEVADTGTGMPPDVLAHAMEPFFSARRDGTGTGLGLAMVYGFLRQSGGDVTIDSVQGQGTTVRLVLPLHHADAPTPSLPPLGAVLLVEDDPADMARAQGLLSVAAAELVQCANADDARQHLSRRGFDLIVTDLALNGTVHGWDLAEAALSDTTAQTRALVVSGNLPAQNPLADRFAGRITTITKPLTPEKLAKALTTPTG
jgi:signal transduction histidine kinase/HAMP domain-containing protein